MRRVLAAAGALALFVAPQAEAHVSVQPAQVEPGADATLTFAVPNEIPVGRVVEVRIALGQGWSIDDAEAKPGAPPRIDRERATARWPGLAIPPGTFETLAIRATAPAEDTRRPFTVVVLRRGAPNSNYSTRVLVRGQSADRSGVAVAALVVAVATAVALFASLLFVGLRRWLLAR